MAAELVRSTLEKEEQNSSDGRSRRASIRRTTSYTPPGQSNSPSVSTPLTPSRKTHNTAFIEGSITPRRTMVSQAQGQHEVTRPRSRDGLAMVPVSSRRHSVAADLANGMQSGSSLATKSRLPRTSALRPSRPSTAAPMLRDEALVAGTRVASPRRERDAVVRSSGVGVGIGRSDSRAVMAGSTLQNVVQSNSKRRPRQPSGELRWS